jgi:hypothetical protein
MAGWPTEYPFPGATEDNGYCVFPADMEEDEHIFFHGTAATSLESIVKDGFKSQAELHVGPPTGRETNSITFTRTSNPALAHGYDRYSPASFCIVAVRINDLSGVRHEVFGIYVDKPDLRPHPFAYCIVPANFVFK